ncbi:hypothetical protein BCV69DRAFT_296820 [Microstroma glucosiphilum]|uniref:Uncharacterized protein n=1 Tax=Pseudomicrostroma glucosiphilum TaxID=1684307 RepID=A0A316UD89_9BASI|nr:hypothetical protein BCV69DRAFT_296820 [Pseudomicrostroma glucosiphilum]PWN22848.1 hypothetical protein BCV69DRAFT_296820 [Pseudomicrostroma glucosiphilum]
MERQGTHIYSLKSALRPSVSNPASSNLVQSYTPADHANHTGRPIRPILVTSASAGVSGTQTRALAESSSRNSANASDSSASSSRASPASLFKPVSERKYNVNHWAIVSLKRSSTGLHSVPSTPTTQSPPRSPQAGSSSSPFLIATLLHLPTRILYAWPIALQGASSGRCIVTQPPSPPPSADTYNTDAVLSESIKVLADVIQAWIKTGPMRESLRRKESRREKGMRKLGENQQDAIWLNDGLGLAQLNETDRAFAMERIWMGEGETVKPAALPQDSPSSEPPRSPAGPANWPSPVASATRSPVTSPSLNSRSSYALPPPQPSFMASAHSKGKESISSGYNSGGEGSVTTPSSVGSPVRPATPRIEISGPEDTALTLGGAVLALSSRAESPPEKRRVLYSGSEPGQQDAVDEVSDWMAATPLSDSARSSRTSSSAGQTSGNISSRTGSGQTDAPVGKSQRKSVTFSQPQSSSAVASQAGYRPPFAPYTQLTPGEEDEPEEIILSEGDSNAWSGSGSHRDNRTAAKHTSLPPDVSYSSANSSSSARKSTGSSSSSLSGQSSGQHQRGQSEGHKVIPDHSSQHTGFVGPTSNFGRNAPSGRIMLTPASSSVSSLSPSFSTHSRGASKLSQEIPRSELHINTGGADEASRKQGGSGGGKLSPVQSFADLKSALKGGFRGSKKKAPALT